VKAAEPDLIDRIAGALPAEIRADFYREMRHCRSLPENDEMLRILRIMQFLTLLIEQAPQQVAVERERLEQIMAAGVESSQQSLQSSEAYRREIDERLVSLPREIARGLDPEKIAGTINENLRQQFVNSTIPQTAHALDVTADYLNKTSIRFEAATNRLTAKYEGAAEDARKCITGIDRAISAAADSSRRASQELSANFHKAYRWSVFTLCGLSVLIGSVLGVMFDRWLLR